MREYNAFEKRNVEFLVNKQIAFSTIQITETGFKKSILDATAPVRTYLLENGIHDYEAQLQGPEHKRLVESFILTDFEVFKTEASLYRPITKKGDPRIGFRKLNKFVKPDDIFALIAFQKTLYVINLSCTQIQKAFDSPLVNPLRDLIAEMNGIAVSVAQELLALIRQKMGGWQPAEILADTGIGRTVESVLGIQMNASKQPDYKGIELKSCRERAKVRSSLFTQAPKWELSKFKSGREIVERYGYVPKGYNHKALHVTLSTQKPNPQGMALNVNHARELLEANEYELGQNAKGAFGKRSDIAVWRLLTLHNRLLTKHRETFWLEVDSKQVGGRELFRVKQVEHTKNPLASQFDTLLEQGKITVDFLLARNSGGDTYSFKIGRRDRELLFPESELYAV